MSAESEPSSESVIRQDIDRVQDDVSALSDSSDNEQVVELLSAIEDFIIEFKRLDAEKRKLEARVDDLDRRVPAGGIKADSSAGGTNPRDQAVLDALEDRGRCKIQVPELKQLYRRHTDIKNKRTLDDRVRHLTVDGPFEFVSPGLWEYIPGSN
ncbi:hypothetical protein [Natronorubrum daqingense]|uniref:Uncharacterized protein n=1 Tax=Natronorubrum daqingense TaxID=588898 RepID=A0A1N7G4N8_9EURY|nr:hypothetical protein [Natronorubrum daqingense]APX98736.1 hypothetical protein BB347_18700 [Natronorubrum daqingense]SIS07521.1 hypothetical protein SAMN05421809_3718 [Natronorubrum daqingense]